MNRFLLAFATCTFIFIFTLPAFEFKEALRMYVQALIFSTVCVALSFL